MNFDAWLQVVVGPGMFSSERSVRFAAEAGAVALVVDRGQVQGSRLRVNVLWIGFQKALVSLPRQPFNASRRVLVDATELAFSSETQEGRDDSVRP